MRVFARRLMFASLTVKEKLLQMLDIAATGTLPRLLDIIGGNSA
jgi:hypothetical protein